MGSGNEIIETQTYFTQPENDWVFDDQQKLTYNNPVFLEQCRRKGIEVQDTGWVDQHNLDIVEEVKEDELNEDDIDDDEDELDDLDDWDLDDMQPSFKFGEKNTKNIESNDKPKDLIKVSESNKSESITCEQDESKDMHRINRNRERVIEREQDSSSKVESIEQDLSSSEISINDLENLFGSKSLDTPSADNSKTISNRDRIQSAIDNDVVSKPKTVKLNIDRTALDKSSIQQPVKPTTIKLNIKQN